MKNYNFFLILFCFFFISCSNESEDSKKNNLYLHDEVECNFLIYMAADNNLERFGIKNLKALQEIGSSENVNIIVLFDRSGGYDRTEGNWSNSKLFLISNNPENMNDDCIFDYEELDMTSADTLYDFLEVANNYFPAKHTVLDLWSHGRGVYPEGKISRSVIEDYTTGYGSDFMMTVFELEKCIKKYETKNEKRIDIIFFDACYMQMIEICYQLHGLTDYIIGAETVVPGNGSDYKNIASFLKNRFSMKELASFLVKNISDSSIGYSYCGINTNKIEDFIQSFDFFCSELIDFSDSNLNQIIDIRKKMTKVATGYPEFVDFFELISNFESVNGQKKLLEKLSDLIIDNNSTGIYADKTKGISINFPYEENEINYYKDNEYNSYEKLKFYEDTKFDEFLKTIFSGIQ